MRFVSLFVCVLTREYATVHQETGEILRAQVFSFIDVNKKGTMKKFLFVCIFVLFFETASQPDKASPRTARNERYMRFPSVHRPPVTRG